MIFRIISSLQIHQIDPRNNTCYDFISHTSKGILNTSEYSVNHQEASFMLWPTYILWHVKDIRYNILEQIKDIHGLLY